MCDGVIDGAFPDATVPERLDTAGSVVLHVVPLVWTLGVWLVLEGSSRRRTHTARLRAVSVVLGVVAAGTLSLLVWRVLGLRLGCDSDWRVVGAAATPLAVLGTLWVATYVSARLAAAALLLLAGGVFGTDVWLRHDASPASLPLVAVQQSLCVVAVCALAYLPPPYATPWWRRRRRTASGGVDTPDALDQRTAATESTVSISWFW